MKQELSASQKRHILACIFLIPFLMGTTTDLYVPSLPAIGRYFGAPTYLVQFTVGLYMLGYALGQFSLGVLSDSLGRRKIIVLSCGLFTLISFLAAFSMNIGMLILCRFLQGVSMAGAGSVCRAIIADCFSGMARTKAMTYFTTSWAIGPIIGPFIGGYLQDYFNWQASFYFFGIYGLLTTVYAAICLPETHFHLAALHLGQIAKTVFGVIRHRLFLRYGLIAALLYSMLVIFNIIAPFLIQDTLHYSAIGYGHIALFLGFGYFLGGLVNVGVIHWVSAQKIILFSLGTYPNKIFSQV